MQLEKYSIGIGDRFCHQGNAQLRALILAKQAGVDVIPVWNKSNREHMIIGTLPVDTRREADEAVRASKWNASYRVDADHIGLTTVDKFIPHCDFFTLDVADFIGKAATGEELTAFDRAMKPFKGDLKIQGIDHPFKITDESLNVIGKKFLYAVKEAARIYHYIKEHKIENGFIVEVSMDETDAPQTPAEMFFILAMIAQEGIPVQTIAPKFSGKFLKGIDYVGDTAAFDTEFTEDLLVITHAVAVFEMQKNLKLSVHSGSDKFLLYPLMHKAMKKYHAGLHLKTAGTTWLEEVIGLAEADGDGLIIAKNIYAQAYSRIDELCTPYATVVAIDRSKLPRPSVVSSWTSTQFASALRHDQSNAEYNLHFRQLVHVAFRIAAEMGERYKNALKKFNESIGRNVTENILKRHIEPLFIGKK